MPNTLIQIKREPSLLHPAQKTLVVGLGGTGKRVLVHLKRRLLEAGYEDSTAQPDLQLICLDFDPAEECAVKRTDRPGAGAASGRPGAPPGLAARPWPAR